jgi:signal peptidase I
MRRKRKSELREWIKTLLVAGAAVVLFRGMVAQAYQIPSGSMEGTLLIGDYIYINKALYGSEIDIGFQGRRFFYHRFPAFRKPRPGDIIVFRYPDDPSRDFIKRCVAVEGQTVEVKDKAVDGTSGTEPFVSHVDPRPASRRARATILALRAAGRGP